MTTIARFGMAALVLVLTSAPGSSQATSQANETAPKTAAAQPASAAGHLDADNVKKGRALFTDWSCGACHTLADAGGTGHVGPSFDGDKGLTQAFVVDRVTNGQGAMPAFGGQLTDPEIALLSAYIVQVAAK